MSRSIAAKRLDDEASAGWTACGTSRAAFSLFQGAVKDEISGADITSSQLVNATLRNTKSLEGSERQSDEIGRGVPINEHCRADS
ncbi:MAG: hypothetical protein ACREBD_24040 [Blastocatellia bacterium]